MFIGSVKDNTVRYYWDEFDGTIYFSDGKKAKVDYDGEFKYKGEFFDASEGQKATERKLKRLFGKTYKKVERHGKGMPKRK